MAVRMKLVSSGDMKTLNGTNCSYKKGHMKPTEMQRQGRILTS